MSSLKEEHMDTKEVYYRVDVDIEEKFLADQNTYIKCCLNDGYISKEDYEFYKKIEGRVSVVQLGFVALPFIIIPIICLILGKSMDYILFGIPLVVAMIGLSGFTKIGRHWAAINEYFAHVQKKDKKKVVILNIEELKAVLSEDGYKRASCKGQKVYTLVGVLFTLILFLIVLLVK